MYFVKACSLLDLFMPYIDWAFIFSMFNTVRNPLVFTELFPWKFKQWHLNTNMYHTIVPRIIMPICLN